MGSSKRSSLSSFPVYCLPISNSWHLKLVTLLIFQEILYIKSYMSYYNMQKSHFAIGKPEVILTQSTLMLDVVQNGFHFLIKYLHVES